MSRKLIAGFRTLVDHVTTAVSDASYHMGQNNDEANRTLEREAQRARRKLDSAMLAVLLAAHHASHYARAGYSQPPELTRLGDALLLLEREARMLSRRFAHEGHSERTRRKQGAA